MSTDAPAGPPASRGRPPAALATARDWAIVDSVARLGAAPTHTLHQLHAPRTRVAAFRRLLRRLTACQRLRQSPRINASGQRSIFMVGPASLTPGQGRPWSPPLAQLGHTLAVGDTLVTLLRPGFAAGITMTDWQGEAELRGWEQPGHPRPDLRVQWSGYGTDGWLEVEVDRGTEAGPAWRRKLARYLTYTPDATILTVTTSPARARNIADLAHRAGVSLLALDTVALNTAALAAGVDPLVYDAARRRHHPLSQALPGVPNG